MRQPELLPIKHRTACAEARNEINQARFSYHLYCRFELSGEQRYCCADGALKQQQSILVLRHR